jgi:membrane protein implicated in regulation of membrane protease activity
MNRNTVESVALRARDKARSLRSKLSNGYANLGAAMAVALTVTPGLALAAAADPGAAISAEVTGAKSTITGILVTLASIIGLFILWQYLKKAK